MQSCFTKEQISQIALKTNFVKRKSKLKAWMFLETLLFSKFNQKKLSLNEIANDFLCNYGLEITKQGVRERFNKESVAFLKWCCEEFLKNNFQQSTSNCSFESFQRVRIKDSTSFQLPEKMKGDYPGTGGSASEAGAKIQNEFDLKNGSIIDLEVTAANINDFKDASEKEHNIEKGDLILRDLGYVSVSSVDYCPRYRTIRSCGFSLSQYDYII